MLSTDDRHMIALLIALLVRAQRLNGVEAAGLEGRCEARADADEQGRTEGD